MRVLKNYISIVLCVVLALNMIPVSFAGSLNENMEVSANHDSLVALGYSGDFLDGLTSDCLGKMVDIIGDDTVSSVYYGTSQSGTFTRGSINNDSLTFEIAAGEIGPKDEEYIKCVLVVVTWEWSKLKPIYRGKDAVSVNWDSNIYTFGSDTFYAADLYKSNANDDWSINAEYSTLTSSAQGGLGHFADLEEFKSYVGGTLLFVLYPTAPMNIGSTYITTINAEYVHSKLPLSGLSFAVEGVGVGITWNNSVDTRASSCNLRFSR